PRRCQTAAHRVGFQTKPKCADLRIVEKPGLIPLRSSYTSHRRDVAMWLAADVIFDLDVVAKAVDETRLPIPCVIFWIVNGDDDLELVRIDLANTFCRYQLVGMRGARGIEESLFLEGDRLHHHRV